MPCITRKQFVVYPNQSAMIRATLQSLFKVNCSSIHREANSHFWYILRSNQHRCPISDLYLHIIFIYKFWNIHTYICMHAFKWFSKWIHEVCTCTHAHTHNQCSLWRSAVRLLCRQHWQVNNQVQQYITASRRFLVPSSRSMHQSRASIRAFVSRESLPTR